MQALVKLNARNSKRSAPICLRLSRATSKITTSHAAVTPSAAASAPTASSRSIHVYRVLIWELCHMPPSLCTFWSQSFQSPNQHGVIAIF